jgi:hypothetical protein
VRDSKESKKRGAGTAYSTTGPFAKKPFAVRRLSDGTIKVDTDDVLKTNPHLNTRDNRWMANFTAAAERGRLKELER